MTHRIGDTKFVNAQGVVGNVGGCVSFGESQERFERKAHAACRTALYLTDPSIDQNNIIRAKGARTQGTCEWIKSNHLFQSWLRGDKSLLWIRGGPGKGKTMMSVYLTEELAKEKSRSLAYYFCVGQDSERNNTSAVLRGLLWQITYHHPNLLQYLVSYFDPPERGKATVLSEETLWILLTDIGSQTEVQRLYCLVDGVDECDEDSMHWLVDKFLSVGRGGHRSKLSLIVLSRPVTGLDDSTCITLDPDHHKQVSDDVQTFIRSKVQELSQKLGLDTDFEAHATRVLLEKSEGTFLWVGFVMGELLKTKSRKKVLKALYSLPKGLPAVYARMLRGIESDERENSRMLLTWTALAFKPLSLRAIADILGCQSSEIIDEEQATLEEISNCAPMLHWREAKVEFVHQSAKDFLLRVEPDDDPVLEDFKIRLETAHLELSRRCLRSLATGTHLQYYSLLNWPKHAKHLNGLASHLFEQELLFFREPSPLRNDWWRKYSLNFPGLPEVILPKLHMACFIGLETWARAILDEYKRSGRSSEEIINRQCPKGCVALDYAASGDSEDLMKLLLDFASNGRHSHEQLECSLRRAVLAQRERAVQLILSHGANVNGSDAEGKSLLHHATFLQNKSIMRILLEHEADPTISDGNGVEPLEVACQSPQGQALVKLLIANGANPNTRTRDGHTLLNLATSRGDLRLMEALLNHGANPALSRSKPERILSDHTRQKMKDLPLHTAIAARRLDTIKLLIDHGADINMRNDMEETAVHIAEATMEDGDPVKLRIIRFLVNADADINAKRKDGSTALHVVIQREKCVETTRILCECGADVNAKDSLDQTALHHAARRRDDLDDGPQLIRLLHLAGGNLDAQNREGEAPLHLAMRQPAIDQNVEALVNSGASFNKRDFNGDTILHIAIRSSAPGLARDEEDDTTTHAVVESLYRAFLENDREALRLLIQRKTTLPPWPEDDPPEDKFFAVLQGNLSLSELLIRHGVHTAIQVALASDNVFLWPLGSGMWSRFHRKRPQRPQQSYRLVDGFIQAIHGDRMSRQPYRLQLPDEQAKSNRRHSLMQASFNRRFYRAPEEEATSEELISTTSSLDVRAVRWKEISRHALDAGVDPKFLVRDLKSALQQLDGNPSAIDIASLIRFLGLPSGTDSKE